MRTIRISEEVWQGIAGRGRFGETEDDVLRRVFQLPENPPNGSARRTMKRPRRSLATTRMSTYISENRLHVEFQDGEASSWALPDRKEKAAIRAVLNEAITFARGNGASDGQRAAVRKALTSDDYHLRA
jgi:negative regulator of replication initiation